MEDNNDKIITVSTDGAEDMCPQVSFVRRNELMINNQTIEDLMAEAKALVEDGFSIADKYQEMDQERASLGLSGAIALTESGDFYSQPVLKGPTQPYKGRLSLKIRDAMGGADPYNGIHPDDFVIQRTRLHFAHQILAGVEPKEPPRNLKRAWRIMTEQLNDHLADGQLEPNYTDYRRVHLVGLGLGGGKSTGLKIYASCLAALAQEPSRCPGMMIVCERITDVRSVADDINRFASEWFGAQGEFAIGWHHRINTERKSKGLEPVSYDELSRFPFLVCTQKAVTYALAAEAINQYKDKRLDKFMRYDFPDPAADKKYPYERWNPHARVSRIGVVFDESILPFYSYSFDKDLLLRVTDMLEPESLPEWMGNKHGKTIQLLKLLGFEMDSQSRKQGINNSLEGTKPKSNALEVDLSAFTGKEQLEGLAELMSDIHTSQWTIDGFEKWNLIQDLANVFFVLQEANPLFYWRTTKFKKSQFQFSQFIVHRLGRGFLCLDATANVSKLSSVYQPIVIRNDIGDTQDFTGLSFITDESRGCSRGRMNGELTKVGEKLKDSGKDVPYTEYAKAPETVDLLWTNIISNWKDYLAKAIGYEAVGRMLVEGVRPQIGVIAFKPVAEGIKVKMEEDPEACKEIEIVVGNIGGVRGSNRFRRCQVMFVNGLNFMSYDWKKETRHGLNALIQHLEETDIPMNGDTLYYKTTVDKIKEQIPKKDIDLYYGELIKDTLQTVGRSAARVSTHELDNGMAACTPAVVLLNLKHRSEVTPLVIDALKRNFVNCSVEEHGWCLDPESKKELISDYGLKYAKKLMSESTFNASMILRWFDQCHDGRVMPIRDIVMDYFRLKDEPIESLRKSADNAVIRLTTRL